MQEAAIRVIAEGRAAARVGAEIRAAVRVRGRTRHGGRAEEWPHDGVPAGGLRLRRGERGEEGVCRLAGLSERVDPHLRQRARM
eukprot:6646771-Prymnesium_polylepis.1